MKKLWLFFLVLGFVAALATGALAEESLERVQKSGVITAGVLGDAPPFGFRDKNSGTLMGYDVDFAKTIASRLGVRLVLKEITSSARITELLDGNVDMVVAALTPSSLRSMVIGESESYLVSGQKVLARRGLIKSLEDLDRKRLGAVVGTFSEVCVKDRCRVSKLVPFDTYLEGIRALREDKIDAFVSDEAILVDLLGGFSLGDYEIPDVSIISESYHIGVNEADTSLLGAINVAIGDIKQTGEAKSIRNKWFTPPDELPPPAYGAVVRRTSSRPRFLGINLNGAFYPDSTVKIFSISGKELGTGTITSVFNEEFYVDVDEAIYPLVQPGFLVAMNMTDSMAYDILLRRGNLLNSVKTKAQWDAEAVDRAIEAENIEQEERELEIETLKRKSRALDRSRYYRERDYDRYRYRHR